MDNYKLLFENENSSFLLLGDRRIHFWFKSKLGWIVIFKIRNKSFTSIADGSYGDLYLGYEMIDNTF